MGSFQLKASTIRQTPSGLKSEIEFCILVQVFTSFTRPLSRRGTTQVAELEGQRFVFTSNSGSVYSGIARVNGQHVLEN